ncbi:MAG: DUF4124 domain-containing protein [Gammaproteobacteria bacterium]|nr:DUF4124 domain-containing protein [Gammaproteobacteria bacterium]
MSALNWSTLLLLLFPVISSAGIYKWVDEKGVLHFTDQAEPGAEPVELRPATLYTPDLIPALQSDQQPVATEAPTSAAVSYEQVSISKPAHEETIHSNEGSVIVAFSSTPALAKGDRYKLLFDGQEVPTEGENNLPLMELQNVDRGTHTLQVEIVDQSGMTLIASEESIFYLRSQSILFPSRTNSKPTPLL